MNYLITNGANFLRTDGKNNISTTKYASEAKTFQSKERAINYAKSLPKTLKNLKYYVVEDDGLPAIFPKGSMRANTVAHISQKEKSYNSLQPVVDPEKLLKVVLDCENSLKSLRSALYIAKTEQSRIDDEIFDIEHAAEFFNYNARDGYKLYKRLHEARVSRRRCKDSIYIIESILCASIEDITSGVPSRKIIGMDNRKFTPRVLTDFFPSNEEESPAS